MLIILLQTLDLFLQIIDPFIFLVELFTDFFDLLENFRVLVSIKVHCFSQFDAADPILLVSHYFLIETFCDTIIINYLVA